MSTELLETIKAVAELLQLCGWEDRAAWFNTRLDRLRQLHDAGNAQSLETLNEIKSVLSGQGSLTDLPLSPAPASGLSRDEARKRQWELAKRLDFLLSGPR